MISGIYSGATALDNLSSQQELIAANLAHLNTPGYRRQFLTFQERTDGGNDPSSLPGMASPSKVIDFSEGIKKVTERKLDVAINGDAFFAYQGAGETLYSRNGILFNDPVSGNLVNGDGMPILDNGQPIQIPPDVAPSDIVIDLSGNVSANGQTFGQLSVVKFDNPQLLDSEGQVYFRAGRATASPAEDVSIVQGTRELANAHPVTELISLIVGSRHFEAAQRAMRTISDSIQENTRS